jgi:hypothetical protein
MDLATINMAVFIAAIFLAYRIGPASSRAVVDVLAVNWVATALLWAVARSVPLPWQMLVDFLCGAWLLWRVPGRLATLIGLAFVPMLIGNAAALIINSNPDVMINLLGWVQMAVLWIGMWGDGLADMARHWGGYSGRFGGGRSASHAWSGADQGRTQTEGAKA